MKYTWDSERGILDKDGRQVLQIVTGGSRTVKLRDYVGKLLAKILNKTKEGIKL